MKSFYFVWHNCCKLIVKFLTQEDQVILENTFNLITDDELNFNDKTHNSKAQILK